MLRHSREGRNGEGIFRRICAQGKITKKDPIVADRALEVLGEDA